jgi:hypothetical protein
MTASANDPPDPGKPSNARPNSEEIIRRLEQFPVEVLEAALLVLQMRQAKPRD